jgi:hypothetical protein
MGKQLELLQGMLDMLILKSVSLGPLHGYGVLLRIQQISTNRTQAHPRSRGSESPTPRFFEPPSGASWAILSIVPTPSSNSCAIFFQPSPCPPTLVSRAGADWRANRQSRQKPKLHSKSRPSLPCEY